MNTTTKLPQYAIEYKGYRIVPVWHYGSGPSDWEVFKGDQERGYKEHSRTLSEVKKGIDEKLND